MRRVIKVNNLSIYLYMELMKSTTQPYEMQLKEWNITLPDSTNQPRYKCKNNQRPEKNTLIAKKFDQKKIKLNLESCIQSLFDLPMHEEQ